IALGSRLGDFDLSARVIPHFGVKEAVFPFNMFPEVDPLLGPEMRSTGEVLGMGKSFGLAFYKASEAGNQILPKEGTVLLTVSRRERPAVLEVAQLFDSLGFSLWATRGTHKFLQENGIPSRMVLKLHEGRPNIIDGIKNKEYDLIINTPSGKLSKHDDSYIRKAAIRFRLPYITTLAAAIAAARGIEAYRRGKDMVKSIQEYHKDIR
ncbi:MAG TPA: carbamoyl phosphate synthase large subunit, partial [Deltaproteobacteria bacterium]|nr:carbamoyl phosphate synthase large subunit [Deltaproteobacteria bacterium]